MKFQPSDIWVVGGSMNLILNIGSICSGAGGQDAYQRHHHSGYVPAFLRGMKKRNARDGIPNISSKLKGVLRNIDIINERLSHLVMQGQGHILFFFNLHCPTNNDGIEPKETFYQKLNAEVRKFAHDDTKIILGDFNAKI